MRPNPLIVMALAKVSQCAPARHVFPTKLHLLKF